MTERQQEEMLETSKLVAKMYALLTGNGSPETGVVHDVSFIKNNMVTKHECERNRKDCAERRAAPNTQRKNTWLVIKDVIVVLLGVITLLAGGGILLRLR